MDVLTGRLKRTDLDMSKVFVGTCPDMCPEKERYMRETRNQLSIFEVIPDTEMVMFSNCFSTVVRKVCQPLGNIGISALVSHENVN